MFDFNIQCHMSKMDGSPKFVVIGRCENRNDAVKLHNLLLHNGYRVSGCSIVQTEGATDKYIDFVRENYPEQIREEIGNGKS